MHTIALQRLTGAIPKGRKVIQLPTFSRRETEHDILNQLSQLSGLSATEKRFVSVWRSPGYRMTRGDRRCLGHMAQIHLGVKL